MNDAEILAALDGIIGAEAFTLTVAQRRQLWEKMGRPNDTKAQRVKVVAVSITVGNVDITARGRTDAEAYDNLAAKLIDWNLFDRASDENLPLRWHTVEV